MIAGTSVAVRHSSSAADRALQGRTPATRRVGMVVGPAAVVAALTGGAGQTARAKNDAFCRQLGQLQGLGGRLRLRAGSGSAGACSQSPDRRFIPVSPRQRGPRSRATPELFSGTAVPAGGAVGGGVG
jgi:hypothetical protein